MIAQQVQTAADAKALIEAGEGGHVKVATVDPDGVIRRRHMARQTFVSVVESGGKLCGAISGGDCVFSHVSIDVAPNIYLYVLGCGNLLLLIGAFRAPAQAVCRHDLLNRVVDRVAGLGYTASTAVQFMVFIFNETPYSARENGVSQPPEHEARRLGRFNAADIGGGGLSSRFACDGLGDACSSRGLAHGRRTGRFDGRDRMLRSASACGQGGCVQNLLQGLRPGARQDADIQGKMVQRLARSIRSSASDVAKRALTPERLSMAPSTAHFYSRQVLGFWAPTAATWTIENRTTALRLFPVHRAVSASAIALMQQTSIPTWQSQLVWVLVYGALKAGKSPIQPLRVKHMKGGTRRRRSCHVHWPRPPTGLKARSAAPALKRRWDALGLPKSVRN